MNSRIPVSNIVRIMVNEAALLFYRLFKHKVVVSRSVVSQANVGTFSRVTVQVEGVDNIQFGITDWQPETRAFEEPK